VPGQYTAGGKMGNSAFIAYLSSLCTIHYTAVQYALLTSFMQMLGKYVIVPASGVMADALGWVPFFLSSAVFALPGLAILVWLQRQQISPTEAVSSPGAAASESLEPPKAPVRA
jgi:PAT family beta-lactamase induction signal transducer AmpG